MIQVFAILLIVGIFAHDLYLNSPGATLAPQTLAVWVVPKLLIAALYAAACRIALDRVRERAGGNPMRRIERISLLYLIAVLMSYAADLITGMLRLSRQMVGDHVLLDELPILAVPVAMVLWAWWCHYPVDRLRKEQQAANAPPDLPPTACAPPTRGQYVVYQLRLQMAIVLVPLLAMTALQESLNFLEEARPGQVPAIAMSALHMLGVAAVLLLAPVALRYLWDTRPLPEGPLKDRLLELCRRHGVAIRQLLLWRTYGSMINGAVMGLIGPLRYILLTDRLIETMPPAHVEAVMAHELAHVKKGHILWLFLTTASTFSALTWIASAIVSAIPGIERLEQGEYGESISTAIGVATAGAIVAAWIYLFGWVSRQFEQQADTFAVQHCAMEEAGTEPGTPIVISDNAARTMVDALESVAFLNHIPVTKPSWRHGSISSRQRNLFMLVGQRSDQLQVDRMVRRIKWVTSCVILALIGFSVHDHLKSRQTSKPATTQVVESMSGADTRNDAAARSNIMENGGQ